MTITFEEYLKLEVVNESSTEFKNYLKVTRLVEDTCKNKLNEDLVDLLPPIQRAQYDFIHAVALQSNLELKDTIKLFKDSRVYAFFKKLGWNLQKLFDLVKQGFDAYLKVQHVIAGLLLFLWLEGTHFIHPEDFDFSEIMEALDGNYDLHHLLGGGHGIRLLAIFVTALTGVGFHYATPKALNFIGALLYSLQKTLKII